MEIYGLSDNNDSLKIHNGLKVTAIKPAIKNENRVNIFVDEKYEFSLDLAQVVDYKIKVGTILTPKKLNELKNASEFGKLYQRTLEWVLLRPHSIRETRDYLKQKLKNREIKNRLEIKKIPLFSEDDIEKIIERLIERKYLDDYRFAEYFLENRNSKKGVSIKKLKLELIKKGINQNIIEDLLSRNIRNDEEEIRKIILKKRKKYDDQKLIQYLVRQGFDFQLAQAAVSETDSQNSA